MIMAARIAFAALLLGVGTLAQEGSTSNPPAASAEGMFTNPVLYEDFADNDIFLGPDDAYYYSASNMHYSPGAPILRSYDLINWEFVGHSVPTLNFGDQYNMKDGQVGYRGGTWASTMRYRESNGLWYWIGCVNFWETHIFTAPDVTGPWTENGTLPGICYYDCGLLIDDDDTMYVAYGGTNVSVAQLSADGLSEASTTPVFNADEVDRNSIEGNRLYKRDGYYYILDDDTQGTTFIWKSTSPTGPYTAKILIENVADPVPNTGPPDQGSLVKARDTDDWYFMSFSWAYPSGRLPILAPITWGDDGFPLFVPDENGGWGVTYPDPLPRQPLANWTFTDHFEGPDLGVSWEWNHNPDTSKYSVDQGVTLQTATVTDDLFHARNTLTHRLHGEFPVGTVALDLSDMAEGDVAGLAAFRDRTSWIGVQLLDGALTVEMRYNATQNETDWTTVSTGETRDTADLAEGTTNVWFRVSMDARPSGSHMSQFFYSTDGSEFTQLGPDYELYTYWNYFLGYRFGIFNYATQELGGSVRVTEFVNGCTSGC